MEVGAQLPEDGDPFEEVAFVEDQELQQHLVQFVASVARNLEPSVPHAAVAVEAARLVVKRAVAEVGEEQPDHRLNRIERAIDELEQDFKNLVDDLELHVSRWIGGAGASDAAAIIAVDALNDRRGLDRERILDDTAERYFARSTTLWTEIHARPSRERLIDAITSELRPRTPPSHLKRLEHAAEDVARNLLRRWKTALLDMPEGADLRHRACSDAWARIVHTYAKRPPEGDLSLQRLSKLGKRELYESNGEPNRAEIENLRSQLVQFPELIDLTDERTVGRVARSAPPTSRNVKTVALNPDWRPDAREEDPVADAAIGGDWSDFGVEPDTTDPGQPAAGGSDLGTDGIDRGGVPVPVDDFDDRDAEILREEWSEMARGLAAAVKSVRQELWGASSKLRETARLLDLIDSAGGYDPRRVIRLVRSGGRMRPDPELSREEQRDRDNANANVEMTRAYKELQARMARHHFALLDDPVAPADSDARARITGALASRRLVLPPGVPRRFQELSAGQRRALELELAGLPVDQIALRIVTDAHPPGSTTPHPAKNCWCDRECAVVDELVTARRAVVLGLQHGVAGVRVLQEPYVSSTMLPRSWRPAADDLTLSAGRAIAVPSDARPVERKHDERRLLRTLMPLLPAPLIKTHKGRWWYFPSGGVGFGGHGARDDA